MTFVLVVTVASIATAQARWARVEPAGMGFAAEFPTPPTARSDTTRDEHGTWINHAFAWHGPGPGAELQINVKDYSRYAIEGVPVDAVLDSACPLLASEAGMTLEHMEPVAGPPAGRRCRFRVSNLDVRTDVFWSAPRLYYISATCRRDRCAAERARIERFVSSFRVVPPRR